MDAIVCPGKAAHSGTGSRARDPRPTGQSRLWSRLTVRPGQLPPGPGDQATCPRRAEGAPDFVAELCWRVAMPCGDAQDGNASGAKDGVLEAVSDATFDGFVRAVIQFHDEAAGQRVGIGEQATD